MDAFLAELSASKYAAKVLFAQPPSAETGAVEVYNEEGYAAMTTDLRRNKVYNLAVAAAAASGAKHILEIGPGADACLTSMACSSGVTVTAVEGNPTSAASASAVLARNFKTAQWTVIQGMSSETEGAVGETITRGGFDVVLQEILGNIASREGVVQIILDLQKRLLKPRPTFWLPAACATFFTPVNLVLKSVRDNLEGPRGALLLGAPPASSAHVRVSRLMLDDPQLCPFQAGGGAGGGGGFPLAGCLEFFDFTKPLDAQLLQSHTQSFTAVRDCSVNGLACWIWAGFPFAPPAASSRRAAPTTAFPYGATGLSADWAGKLSFSSARCSADADVEATNWDNPVMMFKVPLQLKAGDALKIQAWTDARAMPLRYAWICTLQKAGEADVLPVETLVFDSRDIQYNKPS